MKKLIFIICMASILLALTTCGEENTTHGKIEQATTLEEIILSEGSDEPFLGKIAIITGVVGENEKYFRSAEPSISKYGEQKIVHITWPDNYLAEYERVKEIVNILGESPETKAIIVNQAAPGIAEAFEELRREREDIFVVFIYPNDIIENCVKMSDVCIDEDKLGMGSAMVKQAYKMGAETFVHYSFPRQMTYTLPITLRDIVEETCQELGIVFIDATAPDPTGDVGVIGVQQFILNDVPLIVEKYGKDTAFFASNCSMQGPLIKMVIKTGAIYPQPCCPAPTHGFIEGLNLANFESTNYDSATGSQALLAEIARTLSEKDMLGRMSSWSEDPVYTMTNAAVEYTIRYLNGEAPREVDAEILRQIIVDNVGVEAYLTPYVDDYPYTENGNGKTYNNFLLLRMDYITFE